MRFNAGLIKLNAVPQIGPQENVPVWHGMSSVGKDAALQITNHANSGQMSFFIAQGAQHARSSTTTERGVTS